MSRAGRVQLSTATKNTSSKATPLDTNLLWSIPARFRRIQLEFGRILLDATVFTPPVVVGVAVAGMLM